MLPDYKVPKKIETKKMSLEDEITPMIFDTPEPRITINERTLVIPDELKTIGVENDNNVERIYFEVPRYFDEVNDLSEFTWYVNYLNANQEPNKYHCTDVEVEDDKIVFSWLTSKHVYSYRGIVKFIIMAVASDGRKWNSTIAEINVLEGLETDEQIIDNNPDIINELLELKPKVEYALSKATTLEATSESLLNTSKELQKKVDSQQTQIDNAINVMGDYEIVSQEPTQIRFKKGNGEFGDTVDLGDGLASKSMVNNGGNIFNGNEFNGESSDYGLEIEKVEGNYYQETTNGYQLFDASKLQTETSGGATIINNGDGSFTVSGSGNISSSNYNKYVDISKEDVLKLLKVGNLYGKVETKTLPYVGFLIQANGKFTELNLAESGVRSINITEEMLQAQDLYARIRFYAPVGSQIVGGTVKPMFYQDGDGTWERFTGGEPAPNPNYPLEPKFFEPKEIVSVGKNLFDISKITNTSNIINNNDGSLTINTTESSSGVNTIQKLREIADLIVGEEYTLSAESTGSNKYIYLGLTKETWEFGKSRIIKQSDLESIVSFYASGVSTTGIISNIQIENGNYVTKYVPFKGSDKTPLNVELRALPNGVRDTYENGIVTRRVGVVSFNGSETGIWAIYNNKVFAYAINDKKPNPSGTEVGDLICNKLENVPYIDAYNGVKVGIGSHHSILIGIYVEGVNTVDDFRTWLSQNPITVWYELATPTTEYYSFPIIPSYSNYTNAWHDSEIEAKDIQWKAKVYDPLEAQDDFVEEDYIKITETNDMVSTSSHRGGAELLEMDGNYEQVTTNGYQLFDQSKLPTKTAGGATVTNNGDGSFTISGSGNITQNTYYGKYDLSHEDTIKILKEGNIKLQCENVYPFPIIHFRNSSKIYTQLSNGARQTSITNEMLSDGGFYMSVFFYADINSAIKVGTCKPMLYQDGNGEFEPFTGGQPSPSPDYKQDMKAVEVKEIYSSKKTLFDKSQMQDNVGTNVKYIPIYVGDGTFYCYSDIPVYNNENKTKNLFFLAGNVTSGVNSQTNGVDKKTIVSTKSINGYVTIAYRDDSSNGNFLKPKDYNVIVVKDDSIYKTPLPLTLRALPNGVKDTCKNGIVTRRVGVYKLTSIDFTIDSSSKRKAFVITRIDKKNTMANVDNYLVTSAHKIIGNQVVAIDNCIYQNPSNFVIEGTSDDSLETFKSKFLNTEIWYELATPTTEVLEKPFIETYDKWVNIWTDSPINTHMKIGFKNRFGEFYTKKEVDELIAQLQDKMLISFAKMLPTFTQAEMLEEDYKNLLNEMEEL